MKVKTFFMIKFTSNVIGSLEICNTQLFYSDMDKKSRKKSIQKNSML
jgi:hypothetical protein